MRCIYDAGFDTIPPDVQQACVETVADMLNLLQIDQRLGSESDGTYSYSLQGGLADYGLPKSVLGKLAPYRNRRA